MNSGRIHVVAGALIDSGGQVLIALRPAGSHQGGCWEFPGGKLEPGESPIDGLARELYEELGIRVRDARPLIALEHDYPGRRILLDVYLVRAWDGDPVGRENQPLAWQFPQALDPDLFPPADRPVIMALRLPARYLITPEGAPDPTRPGQQARLEGFLADLLHSLSAGIGALQLRAQHLNANAYASLAREVAPVCEAAGAALILRGEPETLGGLPADGWHFTSTQLHQRLPESVRTPGAPAVLGVSCHTSADLARAERLGFDYALLSPVQMTRSHPQAIPLGWDGFARLVEPTRLPVYALGGLGVSDLEQAWRHGAQGIAAIRGFWARASDQ